MLSTPAFFNGDLYYAGINDHLKAFSISDGAINPIPSAITPTTFGNPGASPCVSANGTNDAIVWALEEDNSNAGQAVLHAYNATNVSQELYNSSQVAVRDNPGGTVHFNVPTVANGKVYVGTANSLSVFGNGPPLFFTSTGYFSNGVFQLQLTGWSGKSYILQATTDFVNWVSLSTNRVPDFPLNLSDPGATNFRYRFYRAVSEPGL